MPREQILKGLIVEPLFRTNAAYASTSGLGRNRHNPIWCNGLCSFVSPPSRVDGIASKWQRTPSPADKEGEGKGVVEPEVDDELYAWSRKCDEKKPTPGNRFFNILEARTGIEPVSAALQAVA